MSYWTYILCNKPGGTLYVGMTSDLPGRIYQHREGLADGFTKRYGIKRLVYSNNMKQRSPRSRARRHSNVGHVIGRLR